MRYLLVMNPGSRSGKGRTLWKLWEAGLAEAGVEYECAFTSGVGHAIQLARESTADVVVAVGGDGTINEVLDGIMQSENSRKLMGVLYSGTSPDFCRFHNIPLHPKKAIEALLSGRSQSIDVARITYCDASTQKQASHFGCSSNIGMGASVARYANRWRRYLGDILGTGAGVICTIARNVHVDVDLQIDMDQRHLVGVNNLTIAKNPYIASGLKLQIPVTPDDGKLYIVGMQGKSRTGVLKLLPGYYDGSVVSTGGVFVKCCESVDIISSTPQEIEFDGDPRGYLPARIEILPRALGLIGGTYERV